MANTVIALKKSATPSAVPLVGNLANGELAINYADGKLFYKAANGTIATISSATNSFGTVNANNTLVVADTPGAIVSLVSGSNIDIVGDAINDKITINLNENVVIPSTGTFKVAAVGGDEGGEIKLANAITNSVLTGDIVIDVYQNRLRFYESAGTNRGAFINLASAATGVGTDLLAGASATDTVARNAAGAAFDKANTANITADLAFNHANAAFASSNADYAFSNSAHTIANLAFTHANAAFTTANAALPNTSGVSFAGNLNFPTGIVGIGTAAPTSNLHVAGSLFVVQNNSASLAATGEIAEFAHNANSYTQIHVRNANTGQGASGDLVVTADTGSDVLDFIDIGINGSGYSQPTWTINGPRDGYLYTSHGNLAIGSANVLRSVTFFTGETLAANERARFDPSGNLLIGRTDSTVGQSVKLDVAGAINASAYLTGTGQAVLNNATTLIRTGYTVNTFNAGANVSAYGTWQPNPSNGNYQVATSNGAVTITTPPANCAIDILFINASNRNPGSVTFTGYNVSATPGSTYAVTANQRYILSIREINNIATYSWYAMQ